MTNLAPSVTLPDWVMCSASQTMFNELWSSWALLPEPEMTKSERLAAILRLIIVIAVVLKVACWSSWEWLKFLVVGVSVVMVLAFTS